MRDKIVRASDRLKYLAQVHFRATKSPEATQEIVGKVRDPMPVYNVRKTGVSVGTTMKLGGDVVLSTKAVQRRV